jgi:hypothetical protein
MSVVLAGVAIATPLMVTAVTAVAPAGSSLKSVAVNANVIVEPPVANFGLPMILLWKVTDVTTGATSACTKHNSKHSANHHAPNTPTPLQCF